MSPEAPQPMPPLAVKEADDSVTITAHRFEVKPQAGPAGFRWFVQGLIYPSTKTGSKGEVYFLGRPTRHNVAGPYRTRADAERVLAGAQGVPTSAQAP